MNVFLALGVNNNDLSQVEWSFEWLYTFPVSARALFVSKVFAYSFLDQLVWWLLFPFAVESLDLTSYDLIISSSSGYAKGIRKRRDAVHICYCHTPMRWVWREAKLFLRRVLQSVVNIASTFRFRGPLRRTPVAISSAASARNLPLRLKPRGLAACGRIRGL